MTTKRVVKKVARNITKKPVEEKTSFAETSVPSAYKNVKPYDEKNDSGIDPTQLFIDALPDPETVRRSKSSGLVRDHSDLVNVPKDANGKPLINLRWGALSIPGRREANFRKGFVPCYVDEDKNPVAPGTPGATKVIRAGATLLVRRQDVADMRLNQHEERTKQFLHRKKEASAEELARSGVVDITEDKSEVMEFGSK